MREVGHGRLFGNYPSDLGDVRRSCGIKRREWWKQSQKQFTVRKTRAGDYVVEHGEDLIGQFPHEHDAVNFATMRNDGVKQWEKNVRTFPALTVVSRGTSPPRPGFTSMADGRQQSEIGKGLGFEAVARSDRRFNSP